MRFGECLEIAILIDIIGKKRGRCCCRFCKKKVGVLILIFHRLHILKLLMQPIYGFKQQFLSISIHQCIDVLLPCIFPSLLLRL